MDAGTRDAVARYFEAFSRHGGCSSWSERGSAASIGIVTLRSLLLLILLLGSGCSSFGSAEPADGGTSGSSGTSGGGRACTAPRCEDFETDSWMTSWAPSGSGVSVTDGRSSSGKRAIDFTLSSNETPLFARALGASRHVVVTMQILVETRGEGELDFFSIAEAAAPNSDGIYLVHANREKAFVLEVEKAKDGRVVKQLAQGFTELTRVTFDVNLTTHKLACDFGTEHYDVDLDPDWKPPALYVQAGARYATNITKLWHIRYDDADIVTE